MPPSIQVTSKERWRAIVGATLGLMITFLLMHGWAHWIHPSEELLAFVSPMGATALIVFALPSSPLAQPWAVLGGNTLSALVGLVFAYWVPEPQWACGLAVGAAMVVMFGARCLHPPGGARPGATDHVDIAHPDSLRVLPTRPAIFECPRIFRHDRL